MEHQLNNIKNCPVCNGESFAAFLKAEDHNVSHDTFQIVSCNSCGFKFTNPIPTLETIGEYYKSENYISHSNTKKGLVNKVYQIVRRRAIDQKEKLITSVSSGKSLLDIGCGTGDFLAYCKSKKWNVIGLEPDDDARKLANQNNNIDVKPLESLYEFNESSFDVITMWHVLEHVYNLNKDIDQIKKLLKPNGKLVVAVPNCSSFDAEYYKEHWAAYDLPIHLYHFTPKDIDTLFSKHQMKLEKVLPMYYDAYYISMLSEKYKGGNIVSAFFKGMKSNHKAKATGKTYSSQIYILSK